MRPIFKNGLVNHAIPAAMSIRHPKVPVPDPNCLSSAYPPTIRVPDLERSLLLEPDRWTLQVANLVLTSKGPLSAVVPVLVTLEQVYTMQELELKKREVKCGIEELNKALDEERGKMRLKMDLPLNNHVRRQPSPHRFSTYSTMQNTETMPTKCNSNHCNPDDMLRAAEADARRQELEEMKQWAKETKVNAPIPRDLLPILAKDPAKQMELAMEHMELEKET
ncbi:hypothetical protein DE146DRAFT_753552 [Phaeosphaeria sp. MPI-PUGE-AT-0046c]|nr:hypothetical protein DE146DRAFT_753552 [Phaeosphaeria sp. MPI-PUGE-AT-0046c]